MSQKPVNERSRLETRRAVWNALRAFGVFTVRDLWGETRASKGAIRDYLAGLEAAGHIERWPADDPRLAVTWKLVRDTGIEPPRVRRDGGQVTQGLGREQMWRTMRLLKDFTSLDLAVQASTEEAQVATGTAKQYCRFLHRAGYLLVTRQASTAGSNSELTRYRFIQARNTGPQPPMIQRVKQVYDPNLEQVVWSEEGDSHDDE